MTLLIVNVCAFASRTAKLPQHVCAMSWDHAMFHDFQACFGITGIKKPNFSIFPTEPRHPHVWISFSFLAWHLEIYPRTHMWFFNQLWCTGACACLSNRNYALKGGTFPLRTTSSQFGQKITAACSYHVMRPCQVSWFSGVFWNYRN